MTQATNDEPIIWQLPGCKPLRWYPSPKQGGLKYTDISSETDPIGEYAVRFTVGDRSYLSFIPSGYIDLDRKLISVSIVGVIGNEEEYLVGLPRETLTSNNMMQIKKGAPELVHDP